MPEDDERVDGRIVLGQDEGQEFEYGGVKLRLTREKLRTATVTDMAWVDGLLLVAGASNEEFSSTIRRIPFPFSGDLLSNSLEIYHVSHGMYETASPIRTFVPYGGEGEDAAAAGERSFHELQQVRAFLKLLGVGAEFIKDALRQLTAGRSASVPNVSLSEKAVKSAGFGNLVNLARSNG